MEIRQSRSLTEHNLDIEKEIEIESNNGKYINPPSFFVPYNPAFAMPIPVIFD
jgi:hypothetical protein